MGTTHHWGWVVALLFGFLPKIAKTGQKSVEPELNALHAFEGSVVAGAILYADGAAAKWFSPIHAVVNGTSDSQNSRWRLAHSTGPVTRRIACSM